MCVVPPYRRHNITEPVPVRLCVVSSGKTSELHQFVYTPVNGTVSGKHTKCFIATCIFEGWLNMLIPLSSSRIVASVRSDMIFAHPEKINIVMFKL